MDGEVGMALKAMEYWRCAETGLHAPPVSDSDPTLKFVIAESLHGEKMGKIHGPAAVQINGDGTVCENLDFSR